jgi:hypothetical protein
MYRTVKLVRLQPILESRVLLHECSPFTSNFEFEWNLRSSVVVHYRVDFPSPHFVSSIIRKRTFLNFCRITAFELPISPQAGVSIILRTSSASHRIFLRAVTLRREFVPCQSSPALYDFHTLVPCGRAIKRFWPVQKNTFLHDRQHFGTELG